MKKIAAVVVTYNRKDLLKECLECLLKQDFRTNPLYNEYKLDIVLIDNASTDGTAELLHESGLIDQIAYHNTGANLGGAGGFNYGMRKAVELNYDYIWVMDDDCMTHPDTLSAFLEQDAALNGNYGYFSSVCRWIDGSICTMNTQRHPLTKNIQDFSHVLQPATLASFVSLFIPAKVIIDLGLPIKEFFIWTDDWEFTRRISRKYPCYVCGKSVVTHKSKTNGTGNIALDIEEKIERYGLAYRNDIVLYRREGLKGWAYVLVRGGYHTALVLTKAKSKKGLRLKTILKGNLDGLRFKPEIEYAKPVKTNN